MNRLNLLLSLLMVLITFCVSGQEVPEKAAEPPYIEVIGKAEKEIIPDEIYISITLRERFEGRDKISIQKQEEELVAALRSIGIGTDQLVLSGANARYSKVGWSKKDVMARADYLLLVSTAQLAARVFEKLDQINISEAHISSVSHSKIEEYKKEVRILAIKAAKAKADYLLEAIGQTTGKPLLVTENMPGYGTQNLTVSNVFLPANTDGSYKSEGKVADFEKLKIDASVYVKFLIR